jgi:hypothetical protein
MKVQDIEIIIHPIGDNLYIVSIGGKDAPILLDVPDTNYFCTLLKALDLKLTGSCPIKYTRSTITGAMRIASQHGYKK